MPVKIHFHEKNQFLAFNGRMGHEVKVGEKNSLQMNIHEVNQLPRNYQDPHTNELTVQHNTSCATKSHDKCMYEKLTREMVRATEDNCTLPWFPRTSPSMEGMIPICTKEKDINITYNMAYERITNALLDCNEPCRTLVVNMGGKNYQQRNETWDYGLIYFFFSATSFKTEEDYLYPFRSYAAEFGGYLGLFLGYSLLDFSFRIIVCHFSFP